MLERSLFKEICALVAIFSLVGTMENTLAQQSSVDKLPLNNNSVDQKQTKAAASCSAAPNLESRYRQLQNSPALDPTKTYISADKSQGSREKMTLDGNVVIKGEGKTVSADKIIYDKKNNKMTIQGKVFFSDEGGAMLAKEGYRQIEGERAEFHNGRIWLESAKARADAQHIEVVNKSVIRFKSLTYSTCADTDRFWEMKASKLKIDKQKGRAHANNVTIKIKDIPVLYLPKISFPIDNQRKTGFLLPIIGSTNNSGGDIKLPFYWNIAPNRDATFTSRFLSKRGYQFIGEYRYLQENAKGTLGVEYLPKDKASADEDRHLFYYRQHAKLSKNWTTDVDINSVSDPTYIEDLGNRVTDTALTQLERRVDLKYSQPYWLLLTRLQTFQPLAGVDESYQRLPQLLLTGSIPHSSHRRLSYHMNAELVQFDHKEDVTTGVRLDLMPGISYKLLDKPGYFLHSKLNLRYTAYELDQLADPDANNKPTRSLPIFSIDSGLFFDRTTRFRNKEYTHTLEPRMYYLYVPYRDQSDLPVFDTSRLTLDKNQLFRENRFSGADRQGDANQITLVLTSRFINNKTGDERFRATLGQIYYLNDRMVTLPGETTETGNNSDAIAEISWSITKNQSISASAQWDPSRTDTKVSIFEYQFKRDNNHLLNVAYRFRENNIEQTDLSGIWSISNRWNAVGRWNYSIKDETTLEGIAGLEYNSCCWAMRLVARSFIRDANAEKENSIHFQFVLKGLTKIGDDMESLLKTTITGYQNTLD